MKTYRCKQRGFEIDVPKNWKLPRGEPIKSPYGEAILFGCGATENCNIEIGRAMPQSLDQLERDFGRYALGRQYAELEFGRIHAGGRDHVWARYLMEGRAWTKKYLLVFDDTEYAITTTCFDRQVFLERESVWDAMVSSFRLMAPTEPATSTDIAERATKAGRIWERGYRHFRAGRYRRALELFERGKMVTHEFAWNFLGVSMTLMQMLETGAVPEDEVEETLARAEQNIELCLLTSPGDPVYLDAKKAIEDYRKRHNL